MSQSRTILHHGDDPASDGEPLSDETVEGCSFELHRNGGCGGGELTLARSWHRRDQSPRILVGDFLTIGRNIPGDANSFRPWYVGRVVARTAAVPAGISLRLEGLSVGLGEVFPGSPNPADPPLRFGRPDLFGNDPDPSPDHRIPHRTVGQALAGILPSPQQRAAVGLAAGGDINPHVDPPLDDFTLYGEESLRSVLKELAIRAGNVAWGVDETRTLYFRRPVDAYRSAAEEFDPRVVELEIGREVTRLEEFETRRTLFNRVILTGGYIYDRPVTASAARRNYRFRVQYFEPGSQADFGDLRIRLNVPWIRTDADARTFLREFFRIYARPQAKYLIEAALPPDATCPRPWTESIRVVDEQGATVVEGHPQSVRVQFDHAPVIRLELGPEDPQSLWPAPPHDDRQARPDYRASHQGGGDLGVTGITPGLDSTGAGGGSGGSGGSGSGTGGSGGGGGAGGQSSSSSDSSPASSSSASSSSASSSPASSSDDGFGGYGG